MNYERFKKVIVWLALICAFALPVATMVTSPVFAQGRYRRYDRRDYDRWERRYDRDHWRRRRAYRDPWGRYRYYGYPYRYRYPYGYYDRYGRFHRTGYYRYRAYP